MGEKQKAQVVRPFFYNAGQYSAQSDDGWSNYRSKMCGLAVKDLGMTLSDFEHH